MNLNSSAFSQSIQYFCISHYTYHLSICICLWKRHFAFQKSSVHFFFPSFLTFSPQAFQISHKLSGKEMWKKNQQKSDIYRQIYLRQVYLMLFLAKRKIWKINSSLNKIQSVTRMAHKTQNMLKIIC